MRVGRVFWICAAFGSAMGGGYLPRMLPTTDRGLPLCLSACVGVCLSAGVVTLKASMDALIGVVGSLTGIFILVTLCTMTSILLTVVGWVAKSVRAEYFDDLRAAREKALSDATGDMLINDRRCITSLGTSLIEGSECDACVEVREAEDTPECAVHKCATQCRHRTGIHPPKLERDVYMSIRLGVGAIPPHTCGREGQDKPTSRALAMVLMMCFSLHSVAEGLGLTAGTLTQSAIIGTSIVLHKSLAGLAIATSLREAKTRPLYVFFAILTFSCMTPIGALLGTLSMSGLYLGSCLGIAGGSFLYVTLVELIPKAFTCQQDSVLKFGIASGAFLTSCLVEFVV